MLLVPSSILDLYYLDALARNFSDPLRVGTMRFIPFVLLLLECVQTNGCAGRRSYSPTHGDLTAPDGIRRRRVGGRRIGMKRKQRSVLNGDVANGDVETTGTATSVNAAAT